jgi:trk system potassium uptake protein TrkH
VDSLFTATSATCVTGLAVKDTGGYFTPFGRWVIFALFQAGGLGIMTFSTLFAVLLGRRIGFHHSDIIKSTLDRNSILGLNKLLLYIVGITLTVESAGAACLFLRWRAITDWSVIETAEKAIFHSVSGFCNAGLSLFRNSFMPFEGDPLINLTMILLIFFGGIGFIVMVDLIGLFVERGVARRLSLQSKIAITVSAALILAGAVLLLLFERDNVMKLMTWPQKIWGALFQSVTARTAGFNTLPIDSLTTPSLVFLAFLMFVGASPGSTGGGIKTCTFAVLVAMVFAMLKNKRRVMMFNRSVPRTIVRESLVIFFLSISWVFAFSIIVAFLQGGHGSFMKTLFEIVSAFGTVGLSTGITEGLNDASKICVIVTMFAGRVGPLTLALALAFRERSDKYVFPEENLMVG